MFRGSMTDEGITESAAQVYDFSSTPGDKDAAEIIPEVPDVHRASIIALTCDRMIIRVNGIAGSHSSIKTIKKRQIPALTTRCTV